LKFAVQCRHCDAWGAMENRSGGLVKAHYICKKCGKGNQVKRKGELINIRGPLPSNDLQRIILKLNGEEDEDVGKTAQRLHV
jgi:transposase-like protein